MSAKFRPLLFALLLLNLVVLLGQIWPEGAPPFAPLANIGFMICTLILFLYLLFGKKQKG